jgi:hypothetical protein
MAPAPIYHQLGSLLSSQLSFRTFNADVLPNSSAPYQLLVETTEGGDSLVTCIANLFVWNGQSMSSSMPRPLEQSASWSKRLIRLANVEEGI